MKVKITQQLFFCPDDITRLRSLANKGKLKITKSYLSKIISEKVSVPEKTYNYLLSKISPNIIN